MPVNEQQERWTDDTLNAFLESFEFVLTHGLVHLLVIGRDACTVDGSL